MHELNGQAMGRVKHIHFVGIGGAGMSGIAEVLHNLGYVVSGSDKNKNSVTRHLQALGVNVTEGHDSSHINGSDVVVVSAAVPIDNPELKAAHQKHIPVVPRAEMLSELMRFRYGIAIAGTHGKTTTTSLIASVLAEGGLDPTYVIGGLLNSAGSHARLGSGKYLVAEADESDASFLHLQPLMAVLTNIDADHLENYGGSFQNLKDNFAEFINRLPFYGLAVVCLDNPGNAELIEHIAKPLTTYGISHDADFTAWNIRHEQSRTFFTVSHNGDKDWLQVELNLPGKHNVLNALAAIAIASSLDIDKIDIANALSNFQGIGRRCDVLGEICINDKKLLLIDDYAHHPSEIEAIVSAVRSGWPERRLVVIFQPHRYSRTRDLFKEFCKVLSTIDKLLLLDIYSAGEPAIKGINSATLSLEIANSGNNNPLHVKNRQDIDSICSDLVEDGDILMIMGAGDIGSIASDFSNKYGDKIH